MWTMLFPLRFFGLEIGRRVCLLQLTKGDLVVHSSAPFTEKEIEAITSLGPVRLVLDATTMHDTFSREAQSAFPELPYLVPEGFPANCTGPQAKPIEELDARTDGELQVKQINGLRMLHEYACYHPRSRTLILCDLLVNLEDASGWTHWCMRYLLGVKTWPAFDRAFRLAVANREVFLASLCQLLEWDFDRVVVGHGAVIESDGKRHFREAFGRAGFDLPSGP